MHYSHGSALISDLLRRSLSTTMLFSRVLRRASYDSNGRAPSSSATSAHSERSLKVALALPYRQFMESRVPNFNYPEPQESANKLLYVICSRARKNLHLIAERGRMRGRRGEYQATTVLADCHFTYDDAP